MHEDSNKLAFKASIELHGVRTNNLKNLDVALPLGEVSVVTGVSGSGKSSLVFDTLYGEAYRRYVESLSSFARQYLKALPKPAIDHVRNLPPGVAVRQVQSTATSRSTVGTATELVDLLRVLYAHLSEVRCLNCGSVVRKDHPDTAAAAALAAWGGRKALVAAPLERWGKVQAKELKSQLEAQGFTRILTAAGAVLKLPDAKVADLKGAAVVVDRLTIGEEGMSRLKESLALCFKVGRGKLWLVDDAGARLAYSQGLDCPACGLEYEEPSMALLSFNHPLGACPACQGFGFTADLDWDKVIPDHGKSLATKGVACWNFGKFAEYYSWAKTSAKKQGVDFEKAFEDYSAADWEWVKNGEGRAFNGILGFFAYLESKKYKAHYRIHASRYRRYVVCATCRGDRLSPKALACKLQGENIATVSRYDVVRLAEWVRSLSRVAPVGGETAGMMGIVEALEEARARLGYLEKIGVGYLTLDRLARTLSGGELQRINMARCLGSALTDTLFCLDEPSAGLHARDSGNLLAIIRELRDQGNTVVMVEHERRLIAGADYLVEIGPKAGHEGGRIVYAGAPKEIRGHPTDPELRQFGISRVSPDLFIELRGAKTHNLKDIDVKFPVGAFTAVCGVSGSGKTSLIQHTLFPMIAKILGQSTGSTESVPVATSVGPLPILKRHGEIMLVSQAALGRSSRSNIATYLGMMDEIRKLLAGQPLARKLGLTPGSFSFNTPGGRCETCRGLGTVVEDLSFLGEMAVTCPACDGRRFEDRVLAVEHMGKSLLAILKLTVAEAREFFYDRPHLVKTCDAVLAMGMGYLTLGQATASFSGGEAQRLKLVDLLRGVAPGVGAKPSILIFDEPTTGLSDTDVAGLIGQLRALAGRGHTLIVVEHHLDVLQAADWLVEIGPEASAAGGRLVYQGPPAGLEGVSSSITARYLWPKEDPTHEQVQPARRGDGKPNRAGQVGR